MYAVMGITGQVGSAVAATLLDHRKPVRAIVRNPDKATSWRNRGVEIAIADFNDAAALTKAFRDVEGVFVMNPPNFAPMPGFPETRETVAAIRKAIEAARPPKAVYLSSIGAEQPSGIGLITTLRLMEEAFQPLPIASAFLRAGWFMENTQWDIPSARDEGKLNSFLQPLNQPVPMVATADVGRVAAETLLSSWSGNRFIEVAGPKDYSPVEIAETFEKLLHRRVAAVAVPRDTWVQTFVSQGTPLDRTSPRVEMLDAFNSKRIHFGVQGTEHVRGTVRLEEVLEPLINRK
jgi:NAD(P)H dehydrogenase (quinone)